MAATSNPLMFSCHCGLIALSVPRAPPPPYVNECMCSNCRKRGAAFVYYPVSAVSITKNGPTRSYIWADRVCEYTWCDGCGCLVYWYPTDKHPRNENGEAEMGVNARIVDDLRELEKVEWRRTWDVAAMKSEGVYDENGPVRAVKKE